jgi:hypothetical protein
MQLLLLALGVLKCNLKIEYGLLFIEYYLLGFIFLH